MYRQSQSYDQLVNWFRFHAPPTPAKLHAVQLLHDWVLLALKGRPHHAT
jgi:hypothetical protein